MAEGEKERGGATRLAEKARGVVGAVLGRVTANTLGAQSAKTFVKNAAIGDMYELEAAKLALANAHSPRVKDVAQQMIDDHTTLTHQLRSAMRMNETGDQTSLPTEVDERRKQMLDELRRVPDDEFDKLYLDQQVLAHKETVDLMTGYAARGDNPQLRSVAASGAPLVTRHLRHMERLREELAA